MIEITGSLALWDFQAEGAEVLQTNNLEIGKEVNGSNTILVLKDQAFIHDRGTIFVGRNSNAELHVTGGSDMQSEHGLIGLLGQGAVVVAGVGSTWQVNAELVVGLGRGLLDVSNGGVVTSGSGRVGVDDVFFLLDSEAVVTISGSQSAWHVTNDLYVGGDRSRDSPKSTVHVHSGGVLDVGGTLSILAPGTITASHGTIKAGQLINRGVIHVDGFEGQPTHINADVSNVAGIVKATDNAHLIFEKDFMADPDSDLMIEAGSIVSFLGHFSQASGFITGGGLAELGSSFSPGDTPTGRFISEGSITLLETHRLSMEIGGTLQGLEYDSPEVGGILFLGGTLQVDLIADISADLFAPAPGDAFNLFTADAILGAFDSLNLAPLGEGLKWEFEIRTDALGALDIGVLNVTAVPLPASASLLLMPLLALWRRRHCGALRRPRGCGTRESI